MPTNCGCCKCDSDCCPTNTNRNAGECETIAISCCSCCICHCETNVSPETIASYEPRNPYESIKTHKTTMHQQERPCICEARFPMCCWCCCGRDETSVWYNYLGKEYREALFKSTRLPPQHQTMLL
jgi:hypothetical protein